MDAMYELTAHLKDEDGRLLEGLSIALRKPVDQLITDLLHGEYDRVYPGKREANVRLRPGEALERARKALGWPPMEDDPEADRAFAELHARAQAEAEAFYGNRRRVAAA
jgi:hypothetical protein